MLLLMYHMECSPRYIFSSPQSLEFGMSQNSILSSPASTFISSFGNLIRSQGFKYCLHATHLMACGKKGYSIFRGGYKFSEKEFEIVNKKCLLHSNAI